MATPRKYIRRSVFIGLGGTGRDAVLNLKRHLVRSYGEIPPTVRFLVIDTASTQTLGAGSGQVVGLDGGEFMQISARDMTDLIRSNKEIRSWFDNNTPARALVQGAGQIRPLGRAALYANAANIRARVREVIDGARQVTAGRLAAEKGYELRGDDVQVNFICSFSGGTGSGTWYDLAYYCREQLSGIDAMIAWVLMPDIFTPLPGTRNVVPNFYAAMKELDHHMSQRLNGGQSVSFGGRDLRIQGSPFDYVYLVNKTNEEGQEYHEVSELTEMIGYGLFLTTTIAGKQQGDIWDNIRHQIGGDWEGKHLNYLGFGIGELTYGAKRHAEGMADRYVREIIRDGLLNGKSEGIADRVTDFLSRNRLREDEADDVIDAILPRNRATPFPEPESFGKGTTDAVENQRRGWTGAESARLQREADQKTTQIRGDAERALREQVLEYAGRPNGLQFAKNFLLELSGKLRAYQLMMVDERDTHRHNLERKVTGRYVDLANAMREREAKFFRREVALREEFQNYQRNATAEVVEQLEITRRERAAEVFAHLLNICEEELNNIRKTTERLDSILVDLSEEQEENESARQFARPYSIEIPRSLLGTTTEPPAPNADELIHWLSREHDLAPIGLGEQPKAVLQELLLSYARQQRWYQETASRSIEDVLRHLQRENPDELVRLLEQVDRLAVPMWQYNRGIVAGARTTEVMYIFGVQDQEDTVLNDPALQGKLSLTSYRPSFASTRDPSRIIMLKVRAALPAYVLTGMDRHRESYLKTKDRSLFHLHRDWSDPNIIPDLFPAAGDEKRIWWSLAHAEIFGPLITRRGSHYLVRSTAQGRAVDDYQVRLAQGRVEAMQALLSNEEMTDEIRSEIERRVQQLGNEQVANGLKMHEESLLKEVRRNDTKEDILTLVEQEISDLKTYVESLVRLV